MAEITKLLKAREYQKALDFTISTKERHGKKDSLYAEILSLESQCYFYLGNYQEAINSCSEGLKILKSILGRKSLKYAEFCGGLGTYYHYMGNYKKALEYQEESLAIYRKLYKTDDENLARMINNLGALYLSLGKYDKAEQLLLEARDMWQRLFKSDNENTASTYNMLASLYGRKTQPAQQEYYLFKSMEMRQRLFKNNHPGLARSYMNYGVYCLNSGQLSPAREYLQKAFNMYKQTLPSSHPEQLTSKLNLAEVYKRNGDYAKSERLYSEIIPVYKKLYPDGHHELAAAIDNLASVYAYSGNLEKAENYYSEALEMKKKLYDNSHPDLALSINNLAHVLFKQGRTGDAIKLTKQATELYLKYHKTTDDFYATLTNNIGMMFGSMNMYSEALEYYQKAMNIRRELYKGKHPGLAGNINNLATAYEALGNYDSAYSYFSEALNMYRQLFNEEHYDIARCEANIASMLDDWGKSEEAEEHYLEALNIYRKALLKYFPVLSEEEKGKYWNTMKHNFELFNSFASKRYHENPDILLEMYNNQMFSKGLLLNSSIKIRQNIFNSNNDTLINLYHKWQNKRDLIAQYYRLTNPELKSRKIDLNALNNEINEIEKKLSDYSLAFKNEYLKEEYTCNDVQKALKDNEAAIEMVRYRYRNKGLADSVYYAALILLPGNKPEVKIVVMENGRELEEQAYKHYIKNIKKTDIKSYHYFWKDIAKELNKHHIEKVYFSADGVYHKINPNTLYNEQTGNYLIDEMDITLVGNTRDLLIKKQTGTMTANAVLVGNPAYNINKNYKGKHPLPNLPQAENEAKALDRLLSNNDWAVNLYTGNTATEETVKNLNNPGIVHIATHGNFLATENIEEHKYNISKEHYLSNPLLKSMLCLAGSENTILEDDIMAQYNEDGLLTAFEAMNLNLDSTKLIVLSACMSGLGEVQNGEGVYGLQRAFQVAGADYIVMSLWPVNDMATQQLMKEFYSNWLSGSDILEAFKQAELEIKNRYSKPKFWGAFVIIGK